MNCWRAELRSLRQKKESVPDFPIRSPERSVSRKSSQSAAGSLSIERSSTLSRGNAGQLRRLIIEDGDLLIRPRGDHASGQIVQERLIINLGILHFREELSVLQRDRQLSTQHLQRALFGTPVDSSGAPRSQAA